MIYNPVKQPTMLDKVRDAYWNNQHACDAVMFVGVIALVVDLLATLV